MDKLSICFSKNRREYLASCFIVFSGTQGQNRRKSSLNEPFRQKYAPTDCSFGDFAYWEGLIFLIWLGAKY